MRLGRIVISEIGEQQLVFLREVDGPRSFPIVIGLFEATSIDRRVRGELPPRPLTHDLMRTVIEELDGDIQDVLITALNDHTYFAQIRIRKDGELIELDARPSDALALAVQYEPHLPIFVSEDIVEEVS